MEEDSKGTTLSNVIRIDNDRVREHLGRIVRGTVEETLNTMLEAEADRLCNAGRYERTEARRDQRSGSYDRKLQTKAGEVRLKVPKLRQQTFETAIIERYRRRPPDSRHHRGRRGGQGGLERFPGTSQATWPAGCRADHFRRLHGPGRGCRRVSIPRRAGKGAWFISIATCSVTSRLASCARSRCCSRPSMPRK